MRNKSLFFRLSFECLGAILTILGGLCQLRKLWRFRAKRFRRQLFLCFRDFLSSENFLLGGFCNFAFCADCLFSCLGFGWWMCFGDAFVYRVTLRVPYWCLCCFLGCCWGRCTLWGCWLFGAFVAVRGGYVAHILCE